MHKKNAPLVTTLDNLELNAALNAANIGYWNLNLETKEAVRSLRHDQLFGYPSLLPEWTNDKFFAHISPEDLSLIKAPIEKKSNWTGECRYYRVDDNNIYWLWCSIQFFKFERKHYRLVLLKDISERKYAEINHNLLELIVDGSDDAIIGKDLNGIIMTWNQRAESLYGYTKKEMIGSSIKKIFPEDRQTESDKIILQVKTGLTFRDHDGLRLTKDGRLISVSIAVAPVINQDGAIIGASTVARDIIQENKIVESERIARARLDVLNQQLKINQLTEMKNQLLQAEVTRKKILDALAQSNQELKQMVYIASHDLQEPLRGITNYLLLIERRYKDKLDQDANDFINYAVEGAKKLQEMINELLIYSRIDTKGALFEKTDLTTILKQVILLLDDSIKCSKAMITYDALPLLMVDKAQIAICFQNLISNAIKFSKPETPPKIHISVVKKAHEWLFSISDNGIGIDVKYQDQLFIMFKRLVGREYPGNGMGLALCKKVIERNGGKIWVESALGKGAVFYFTLPMTET